MIYYQSWISVNLSCSIYTDIIFYLNSTNRAFLQIFTTFYASGIMLTRQINTIFFLVATYHTCIWVGFHTHHCCLYLAHVCLIWTYFEHCFITYLKELRSLSLHWKTLPCAISCTHILDIIFSLIVIDLSMRVAQMLIISKIK